MTQRDPYDGQPFYCEVCGFGFDEFMACEEPDCVLESVETAQLRQRRRKPMTSDFAKFKSYTDK